jgi:hypothetical protein
MNGKCTNCGKPSATDYCADCEPIRDRLEAMRAKQIEDRKKPSSGKSPRPNLGDYFFSRARLFAAQRATNQ